MKRLLFFTISAILTLSVSAQITKQDELFKAIPVINNKVAFVKEIQIEEKDIEKSYTILKEWARENYGKDPFVSSVKFDDSKKEIIAKSKIELILPPNSAGVREKMVMRYRINGFLTKDKCILEFLDISFLHDNSKDRNLPRILRAEDFITDKQIAVVDNLLELKDGTRKSTLYFLNTLCKEVEKLYGY